MLVNDQNRIWVSTITQDNEYYQWWVLDRQGQLLARFKWEGQPLQRHAQRNPIRCVRDGYLYAYQADEEEGTDLIVKYRFQLEERQ